MVFGITNVYGCISAIGCQDSLVVWRLISKSREIGDVSVDSAFYYSNQAMVVAKNSNNNWLISISKDRMGVVLRDQGRWSEAIGYFDDAIMEFEQHGYFSEAGQVYLHLGNLYYREGEVHELRSAFELADKSFGLALSEYQKGLEKISFAKDSLWIAHCYLNLGAINYKLFNDDEALYDYKMAAYFFNQVNEPLFVSDVKSNIGLVYKGRGNLDSASFYYQQARLDFIDQGNLVNWTNVDMNLAAVYEESNSMKAIYFLEEADSLALLVGNNVQRSIIHEFLYRIYSRFGDAENALKHLEKYVGIKDSLLSDDFKSEELDVRYKTSRQKELIEKQKNENLRKELALSQSKFEKQVLWVVLLVAVLMVFSLVMVGWYRKRVQGVIQKQREKINAQKIEQLRKEQAVRTFEALLKGQEKERGRISEDLHDRLGSTLSAVRMQIEAYGENEEVRGKHDVEKLLGVVDRAIEETRSISHNLVSGVLANFGLEAALHELQENFNVSERVKVHLEIDGVNSVDSGLEVEIFRVVQEILNNALKHAESENIWIKGGLKDDCLEIEISDDGKGFDFEQKTTGLGLKNIAVRIERLKGNLDITSHLGGGTCFRIQIPTQNETSKHFNC